MEHHARHLAGTAACNLGQCACGMLHVTVGPITMRLEPGAAGTLRDVLIAGLAAMEAPRATPHLRLAASRGDELA